MSAAPAQTARNGSQEVTCYPLLTGSHSIRYASKVLVRADSHALHYAPKIIEELLMLAAARLVVVGLVLGVFWLSAFASRLLG
jgi:hypothetical protein